MYKNIIPNTFTTNRKKWTKTQESKLEGNNIAYNSVVLDWRRLLQHMRGELIGMPDNEQ